MRTPLRVAVALLLSGTLAAAPQAQSLPDRLADTTYWRMISEFSEPGGYFRSDNFISNETAWQMVIPELLEKIPPQGVYLGVGPEQNLTYIVNLKPRLAFIVDIRRQNLVQHLMYKAIAELSPTRADFVSLLFSRPKPADVATDARAADLFVQFTRVPADSMLYHRTYAAVIDRLTKTHGFPLDTADKRSLEYVLSTFYAAGPGVTYSSGQAGGGFGGMRGMPSYLELMMQDDGAGVDRSFLATEDNYQTLRDYHARNAIIPLVGNFAGPTALRRVGDYVRAHNAVVNVFYLSNVEQYLFQQGDEWFRFYTNVGTLPLDDNSTFIRSVTNRGGMGGFARAGTLMAQLTASMDETVKAFTAGQITTYYAIISMSR
jgi:hypothetical protein